MATSKIKKVLSKVRTKKKLTAADKKILRSLLKRARAAKKKLSRGK